MRSLSVLVVQPQKKAADKIVEILEAAGHSTTVVRSGERAIDSFVQQPTAALVVDMALPGRDAQATIESIRFAPGGDRVTVILTGSKNKKNELDETARIVHAIAGVLRGPELENIPNLLARTTDEGPTRMGRPTPEPAQRSSVADAIRWKKGDDPEAEGEGEDVEKRAALVAQNPESIEGDLAETPFARVLSSLGDMHATGALVVVAREVDWLTTTGETPKKVVFFRDGVPVYVRSNLVQECLGQVLSRMGLIEREDLDESVRRVREGDGRQGGLLIAMGAITPHALRDALEQQLRTKLFDLFGWTQGMYRFSGKMAPPPETVTLDMSMSEVLLRGVASKIPPPRLLRLLHRHLDAFVQPDHARIAPFLQLDLPPEARRALAVMDGTQRLRQLLSLAEPRPGAAAQVMYAFECAGAITYTKHAEQVAPVPDAERVPEPKKPSQAKTAPDETVVQSEIEAPVAASPQLETAVEAPPKHEEPAHAQVAPTESVESASRDEEAAMPNLSDLSSNEHSLSNKTVSLDLAALDARVNRIFHAERYFHRGEKALSKDRTAEAIAAFEQACELCPEEGEFLAHLAYARFTSRPDDEEAQARALDEINRAVLLSPKLDVVHVLQAKILRARGDLAGARNAYQHALAANPDASEALDGLRELT